MKELFFAPFHGISNLFFRPNWARSLTYTILSGLLQDMKPYTLTVAWCNHYDPNSIPPELYNLRMSYDLTILFVPNEMKVSPVNQRAAQFDQQVWVWVWRLQGLRNTGSSLWAEGRSIVQTCHCISLVSC